METFWKTIALYNSSTWVYQLIITLTGICLTAYLIKKPCRRSIISMKIFLIALYLWISIVYFYIYCAERSYNNVMAIFWGILAASWLWDLLTGPIASILRGMDFPTITSPVMPCSVVVFTIGILLMFSRKINLFIVLLLCHWAMIGFSKTFFFKIPEDYLLASASVPAIYLFFKEYFLCNLHDVTKPQTKYINWLLIILCIGVGIILMGTLFIELAKDI